MAPIRNSEAQPVETRKMKILISNHIELKDIPENFALAIIDKLTVENPQYNDAMKRGRWTGYLEQYLYLYEQPAPGQLIAPRGFINQLCALAKKQGVSFILEDKTREMKPVAFQFKGKLRKYQKQAATAVLRRRFGVLQAPTGSGKTVIALAIIAERRQPALVVVHTRELLSQWVARIHSFLGIPVDEIGVIGGGKMRIGERISVGTVQSIYKIATEVSQHVKFLLIDECHRVPSRTFSEAISAFDSKYQLGLSATAYRRDGLTKLINFYIGDTVHRIDQKELTESGAILPFRVRWIKTAFATSRDPSNEYSRMLSELTEDPGRNQLVCQEAAEQVNCGGGIPLVLSDRKKHCQALAEALGRDHGINADMLTGDLSKKAREKVVAKLNAGACQILVATGQLIGEGFDLPALGAVVLTTPIRFQGRLAQSIGRALRPSPGQDIATVVDFVDVHVGVLKHSARKRLEVYRSLGAK
jgi:superfamily II DNA or RNA helicase